MEAASEEKKSGRQQNKATTRVLNILSLFASEQAVFGVTELSQRLGITKNMAYRALTTLVDQGFLVRDGTKYELGYGVLDLIFHTSAEPDFKSIASPHLQELHELTGETVILSVRMKDSQVIIDGLEGVGKLVIRLKIGTSLPLHVSAASRAILAYLPDEEIENYIGRNSPLQKFTKNTLSSRKQLWNDIEQTREQGFATAIEDYKSGSNSIAFPIMAENDWPHGSITVGGPKARFSEKVIKQRLPEFQEIIGACRKWAALYQSSMY